MAENKIDSAFSEVIDFLKKFFTSYTILFHNPRKLLSLSNNIQPRTLAFLSCFIFSIAIPFSHGTFLSDLIVRPLDFFKALRDAAETSIVKSFIVAIPYFGLVYLLGKLLTSIFFTKQHRLFFRNIYYCYVFWSLLTVTFLFLLLASYMVLQNANKVSPFFQNLLEFVLDHDWLISIIFLGIPVVNILGLYKQGRHKYFFIPLTLFAFATVGSIFIFDETANLIESVMKRNTEKYEVSPSLFFSRGVNRIHVYPATDSVCLETQVVLSNMTDNELYSYGEDMVTISWPDQIDSNVSHTYDFSLADFPQGALKKIEKNSMQVLKIQAQLSVSEWEKMDSLLAHTRNKDVFQMRLNGENYEFNSYDGTYRHSTKGYMGSSFKQPVKIEFSLEPHKQTAVDNKASSTPGTGD